jgi:ketosteroid isomerase-like protein
MRRPLYTHLALLLILVTAGCVQSDSDDTVLHETQVDPALAEQAVEAVLAKQAQGIQNNNIASLDSIYSDGTVFLFEQGGVDSSWANYRDHHLKPELDAFENLNYSHEGVSVHVNGDMALATGRYSLTAKYKDRDIESKGVFSTVLEKGDDGWKIIQSHTSRRPNR